MRSALLIASLSAAAALAGTTVFAQDAAPYYAGDLLSPCQEADNDARWGEAAEVECEQYILGFVGALDVTGTGKAAGICPPTVNTADEVRWAFMRWVHASYSKRKAMPAQDALLSTLSENYACE